MEHCEELIGYGKTIVISRGSTRGLGLKYQPSNLNGEQHGNREQRYCCFDY